MRRAIILSIALLVTLLVPFSRAACGCTQPPLTDSFQKNNVVVKATVTGNKSPSNGKRFYGVRVTHIYKGGCSYKTSDTFVVSTNATADQCGVFMSVNTTYVLMGNVEKVTTASGKKTVYLLISRCQFRGRFNALNDYQKQRLLNLQAALPSCNLVKCNFTSCGPPPSVAPCPGGGPTVSCDYNKDIGRCAWNISNCKFPCQTSSDCDTTKEYCSSGKCRTHGTCGDVADCINPNNHYPVIECVGYLQCKQGFCGRTCGPECPPNAPLQNCSYPACAVTLCLAGTFCKDYNCGQCRAFCF